MLRPPNARPSLTAGPCPPTLPGDQRSAGGGPRLAERRCSGPGAGLAVPRSRRESARCDPSSSAPLVLRVVGWVVSPPLLLRVTVPEAVSLVTPWPPGPTLTRLGLALAVGLFVGLERERRGK